MRPKPIIGVPADRRVIEPHPFHMAGEKYLKAVTDAANAVPLIIPVLADDLEIDELVDQVDGVLLTGSPSDIEFGLHRHVYSAIDALRASNAMRSMLGDEFVDVYCELKDREYKEFQEIIMPWEREILMFNA